MTDTPDEIATLTGNLRSLSRFEHADLSIGDEAADMIERQAAEIAALRAETAWRPIAEAPKDGTEILAYSEHGWTGTMLVRWIAMVDFLTDSEIEEFARQGASDEMLETPDWFHADFAHGDRLSPDCYPTHWMPVPAALPSPPSEG